MCKVMFKRHRWIIWLLDDAKCSQKRKTWHDWNSPRCSVVMHGYPLIWVLSFFYVWDETDVATMWTEDKRQQAWRPSDPIFPIIRFLPLMGSLRSRRWTQCLTVRLYLVLMSTPRTTPVGCGSFDNVLGLTNKVILEIPHRWEHYTLQWWR